MKRKLLILLLVTATASYSQQYDGVHIERSKIDKNNLIYTLGKEFTYTVDIIENDTAVYLKNNDYNKFDLTRNSDSVQLSEIHMTVYKPKMFKRVNKNQTSIIYAPFPVLNSMGSTGLVENGQNIWLHPYRSGFFQSLETCPYPYIKLGEPVGYKWSDRMSIGTNWSNKIWGEWENRLLLTYEYEILAKEKVVTNFGAINCVKVRSIATSEIGSSELISYFSEKYGFVKLQYTLFTGIKIELNLNKVLDAPIVRSPHEYLEKRKAVN